MTTLKAIYALYPDPDSAQRAVDALRDSGARLGVKADNIAIVSSEPFEEHAFGHGVEPRSPLVACLSVVPFAPLMRVLCSEWLLAPVPHASRYVRLKQRSTLFKQ